MLLGFAAECHGRVFIAIISRGCWFLSPEYSSSVQCRSTMLKTQVYSMLSTMRTPYQYKRKCTVVDKTNKKEIALRK